jgi:signal transduction histidine kinase
LDTKLKRFNPALKAAAFVLIVALSVIMTLKSISIAENISTNEPLWFLTTEDIGETDYLKTNAYKNYMQCFESDAYNLVNAVGGKALFNPEAAKQDLFNTVEWELRDTLREEYDRSLTREAMWEVFKRDNQSLIESRKDDLFSEVADDIRQMLINLGISENSITQEMLSKTFESDYSIRIKQEENALFESLSEDIRQSMIEEWTDENLIRKDIWDDFETRYAERIKTLIEEQEQYNPEELKEKLDNYAGIVYYVEVNDKVFKNTEAGFDAIKNASDSHFEQNVNSETIKYRYIYGAEESYIAERNSELASFNAEVWSWLIFAVLWLVAYLTCAVYLVSSAGRKKSASVSESSPEPRVRLLAVDKIFCELTLALIVCVVIYGDYWLFNSYEMYRSNILKYVYFGVLTLFFTIFYALFLSVVRNIKNGTFIKNFLLYKIIAKISKGIGFLYSKGNPMLKTAVLVTVLGLLTMIPFVGFISVPLALFLACRQAIAFKKLKSGVKAVKNGIYGEKIRIYESEEFAVLASDINEIAEGLGEEVERRLKSERLKTELIVNVSHDIRTPLTSLITYADLLEKEETDNENIIKYAGIISQKSARLKTLTDDLFESSKAASGNINVNFESVEINSLLIQALAEFDDKIKQTNLEFKLNFFTGPEEKVSVIADGALLWRVVENLMSNALKYSLESSRVYVDVYEEEGNVFIEMKNISKTELNIPEDEITERFKRGDLSRNSEGSGLGLDIASSLMRCQNGELTIKIDGDLFKVKLRLVKTPTSA